MEGEHDDASAEDRLMPSLYAPAPIGASISGFTEAFLRAQALRQQQERQAQLGALTQLQIAREEEQAREAGLARSVVPQILAAPPQPVEMAPGRPPSVAIVGEPGTPDELGVATPGRSARVEHALTPSMLARQPGIGPEGVAAALTSPAGRAALQLKGVLTEEELERRKRTRRAFEAYRDAVDESTQAFLQGDAERGLLAEAKAYRALAEVADDRLAVEAKANAAVKDFFKARQDTREREAQGRDLQRIAQAHAAFHKAPGFDTHAGLVESVMAAESDAGRRKALEIADQMARGKMDEIQHAPFRKLTARAAQLFGEQDQQLGKGDWVGALRQAAREDPEAAGQAFSAMLASGKEVPDVWQRVFFGQVAPKTAFDLAKQMAESEGHLPGSPAYLQAVAKHLKAQRPEQRDREAQELNSTLTSLVRREATLGRELETALSEADRGPIRDELAGVRRQIRGIQRRLERRGVGTADEPVEPPSEGDKKRVLDQVLQERHPGRRLRDITPAQQQRVADEVGRRLEAGR
jgi:hypothetical protein